MMLRELLVWRARLEEDGDHHGQVIYFFVFTTFVPISLVTSMIGKITFVSSVNCIAHRGREEVSDRPLRREQ